MKLSSSTQFALGAADFPGFAGAGAGTAEPELGAEDAEEGAGADAAGAEGSLLGVTGTPVFDALVGAVEALLVAWP